MPCRGRSGQRHVRKSVGVYIHVQKNSTLSLRIPKSLSLPPFEPEVMLPVSDMGVARILEYYKNFETNPKA